MRWKTTVILAILAVGVGTYVSLYEIKQPSPEKRLELARQALEIPTEEVTALSVLLNDLNVSLVRESESWRMTSPLSVRAEEGLIRRILYTLDPLEAAGTLDASPDHPLALADFGLAPPRATLIVTAGERTTTILLGEATAVGTQRYAKLADSPTVFVIDASLFETINQPLEVYRSRELLTFDPQQTSEIVVTSPQVSYTLAKEADRWRLTAPVMDAADSAAVSTLLSKLRNLRVVQFISDAPEPAQLTEWGLEAPTVHIALGAGAGNTPLELFVGHKTSDDPQHDLYMKRSDEPAVYSVATGWMEDVLREPNTLRAQTLFEIFTSQVTKVQVDWQGRAWTLESTEGTWRASDGPSELDASKVEAWLWKLRDATLLRFVDDSPTRLTPYGLDPPAGMIQIWIDTHAEPTQLLVGGIVEGETTRYGRLSGRPSIIELPALITDLLATTPEVFVPTTPQPASPSPTQADTP